jgi:hypothetical protein
LLLSLPDLGSRAVRLDEQKGDQLRHRYGEERDNQQRAPTVGLPLDQRMDERRLHHEGASLEYACLAANYAEALTVCLADQ